MSKEKVPAVKIQFVITLHPQKYPTQPHLISECWLFLDLC